MTQHEPGTHHPGPSGLPSSPSGDTHGGVRSWMMIACCIPMLVIAVALVVTGVVSISFLVFAVACTAMMALMMRGMRGMDGHGTDRS